MRRTKATPRQQTGIIGHRGAAGLALENTIESFRKAFEVGVDTVEFDVHTTKDGVMVVIHDPILKRVSGSWARVRNLTYQELRAIPLHNGEYVPTLEEVLRLVHDYHVKAVVEIKAVSDLAAFCNLLDTFQQTVKAVAVARETLITSLHALRPELPVYFIGKLQSLNVITVARRAGANGIDLNYWLLNPIAYWLARRHKLDIMVYTVNLPFVGWFITKLYPAVEICSNMPQRLLGKSRKA